jgi:hypothetical protein
MHELLSWIEIHPWMSLLALLLITNAISDIGTTTYECNCDCDCDED